MSEGFYTDFGPKGPEGQRTWDDVPQLSGCSFNRESIHLWEMC